MFRVRMMALALLACGAPVACGGDGDPPRERPAPVRDGAASPAPPELPPEVRTSIEEGNAAFEVQDYEGALEHYRAAVAADSTAAPAWFGVYMTYDALGEVERARETRRRLRELGAPAPGDPHALPPESGPATLEGAGEEDGSA